jgi:pseudoazurin
MKFSTRFAIAFGLGLAFAAGAADAADIQVKMLNRGAKGMMVFEPDLIKIAPGDTVTFVATNPGHDARSIAGMIPEGAEPFEGKLNKDLTVTFTKPGVYGVECRPHYAMGMVAAVIVGDPVNLDAAKAVKQPPMAGKKFAALLGGL